jgi:hypothetical protein
VSSTSVQHQNMRRRRLLRVPAVLAVALVSCDPGNDPPPVPDAGEASKPPGNFPDDAGVADAGVLDAPGPGDDQPPLADAPLDAPPDAPHT